MTTAILDPNRWADFWYYEIGVNVIPAINKIKKPLVKWTEYQDKEIPEEQHKTWKESNSFKDGLAIICGKSYHGEYKDKWLNGIDCDNKLAIDELCPSGIDKIAQMTIVEQHANKEKCHILFFTEEPIQNQVQLQGDNIPKIEIKSKGKNILYCAGGLHKDGSLIGIIGIKKIKTLDKEALEQNIEDIFKKYKLQYLKPKSTSFSQPLYKVEKKLYEGENRGQYILSYLDSKKIKNPEFGEDVLFSLARSYEKENCVDVYPDSKIKELVLLAMNYGNKKVIENNIEDKKKAGKIATEWSKEFLEKYSFATLRDTEEVLYYQKGVYLEGGEVFIKELCQQKSKGCSIHITREVIGKIQRSTYKNRSEFDNNSNILNLRNGLLDIKTGLVTPHNKDQLYRIQLPIEYEKDAQCPIFDKCLSQWLPDERDRVMIIEQAANILLKKNGLLVVAMYNGFGGNAKSTWLNFLSTFLGKENIAAVSIHDLVTNRFAAARLDGKLANIYPDIENTELEYTGKFKLLSAGDSIEVEKKGKDAFIIEPIAKHFFSTNKMPIIYDDTDALYRRFQVTDFTQQFLDNPNETDLENGILPKDPFILEKICTKTEFSGFLNLLITTAKKLQEQKCLTYPQSIAQVREVMKTKADPVTKFATVGLIEKKEAISPRDVVYQIYGIWSRSAQEIVMSAAKFNAKLKQTMNVLPNKMRLEGYDNPVNVWVGIQINPKLKEICSSVPDVPEFYTGKTKQKEKKEEEMKVKRLGVLFGDNQTLEQPEHLEQKEVIP